MRLLCGNRIVFVNLHDYMPMKRVIYALAALVALCCACSNEEEVLPQQREKLVSYLESSHAPALVEESEADKEARQPFYSLSGSTVYRYIETYYAPGRESRAEVTSSSKVTIIFWVMKFTVASATPGVFRAASSMRFAQLAQSTSIR